MKKLLFVFISIIIIASIIIFILGDRVENLFKGLNLMILILIFIGLAILLVSILKRKKELEEGQPLEDEMTERQKFKAGYYAYISSMYMWLFLFLVRGYFPKVETLLGGGILISAIIFAITKIIVKKNYHA